MAARQTAGVGGCVVVKEERARMREREEEREKKRGRDSEREHSLSSTISA